MAKASVPSGNIQAEDWYQVSGTGDISYAGTTYTHGQRFVGLKGMAAYTITGIVEVWQELSFQSLVVESIIRADAIRYSEQLVFNGPTIETETNPSNARYPDNLLFLGFSMSFESRPSTTERAVFHGISIELEDHPHGHIIWLS